MRIKAFVVIDTNVLVSAIISKSGYPYDILSMIGAGNVIPVFDRSMILEYKDVFGYKKLKISAQDTKSTLRLILEKGILIHDVEKTKKILLDNDDIPFFEVKESSGEFDSVLVTGNIKHYPEERSIITPKEFVLLIYHMERFVKREIDYDKSIELITRENLKGEKYLSGKELLMEMYPECLDD